MGVPEVLDQLCGELLHSILIVVHPDFHQVCPVCDVPLGPKLRYAGSRELDVPGVPVAVLPVHLRVLICDVATNSYIYFVQQ